MNTQVTLIDGEFPHTFKKTDSDFAAVSLSKITVPLGRFICVSICYNTDRSIKLNESKCKAGDRIVNPSKFIPNLNILLYMYNLVGVDAANNTLDNHIPVYPYPTIGALGAAVHYILSKHPK